MEHPLHPIPSSPAGLYEDIQWSTGLWGVLGFSFFLGAVLRWLYSQSLRHIVCLLIYSQCAFALLVAHSFNEFLILTYDPAPFVCFGILIWLLRGPRVASIPFSSHMPATQGGGLSWR